MLPQTFQLTTAAIYKGGNFKGSGLLFTRDSNLYCITVAHNLYGVDLNETCVPAEILIKDNHGKMLPVDGFFGNEIESKEMDIALLDLGKIQIGNDYAEVYFSEIPATNKRTFILRGYYGNGGGPETRQDIKYKEKLNPNHFTCTIDRQMLANRDFQYGSEWLKGLSGSALFYDNKEILACAGVLISIPDFADHATLKFCSVESLRTLGFDLKSLPVHIFEPDTSHLTNDWFDKRIDFAVAALGERYTPDHNFELDIVKVFDGLSRNQAFKNRLDSAFEDLMEKRRRCYYAFASPVIKTKTARIDVDLKAIHGKYLNLLTDGCDAVPFQPIIDLCDSIQEQIYSCLGDLYQERRKVEATTPTPRHSYPPLSSETAEMDNLYNSIQKFNRLLNAEVSLLVNNPSVILQGEAGYGKSHLLADLVKKRMDDGHLSMLLLGQHFVTRQNPWQQIINHLLLPYHTERDLLSSLNAKAALTGHRLVIFIDAINEGQGKLFWRDYLRLFIETIKQYKWLGVVVSVRTGYHAFLVDETIYNDKVSIKLVHTGFSEAQYEAADYFFDNYGIEKPSIPLLHPEFRSPLFLRLFCEGLKSLGRTKVPDGHNGLSKILEFFLNGINEKLAVKHSYVGINLVRRFVMALAKKFADEKLVNLPYEDAVYFTNSLPFLSIIHDRKQFLDDLISEGVLAKNMYYFPGKHPVEGVYFMYERFFDYLVATELLQKANGNCKKAFSKKGVLYPYFKDEQSVYQNAGLAEALSVLLPEEHDLELFELVPDSVRKSDVIASSFTKSLIWRNADSFSEGYKGKTRWEKCRGWLSNKFGKKEISKYDKLLRYVQDVVIETNRMFTVFMYDILLVTSNPKHIFNAEFIHKNFIRLSMAERDAKLQSWLSNEYYDDDSSIQRIIDWSWKDEDRSNLSDESVLLTSITLSWFLISADRNIRDRSTKALVSLLEYRPHLLLVLLKKFEGVNDPYVYQRLLAAAYGVSLRTKDNKHRSALCEYLNNTFFSQENVYPDLLTRDYAKGIIDYARYHAIELTFDPSKALPPYSSEAITDIPDYTQLKAQYVVEDPDDKNAYYQEEIFESMKTGSNYGDFGRYTFANALSDWDVDPSELSRYAIKRIFDMGYSYKIHGEYERSGRRNRNEGSERIGKKYQWIAMMEVLARVADHADMKDSSNDEPTTYKGTWEPNVRDIDPTLTITKTMDTKSEDWVKHKPWWLSYHTIDFSMTNRVWMGLEGDIPAIENLVNITDGDGVEWISLWMHADWDEKTPLGEERFQYPVKRMYVLSRAYLVKEEDFAAFSAWAVSTDFYNEHLPDPASKSATFYREYYWSQCYKELQKPWYGGNGDETFYIGKGRNGKAINVHLPVEEYFWDKAKDRSKERPISFYMPSEKIWYGLDLRFTNKVGEFADHNGIVLCQDPSVNAPGPSTLLVRRDVFELYLAQSGYKLCWLVFGQKQILSGRNAGTDVDPRISHRFSGHYWLEAGKVQGSKKSIIEHY
ncbi:hypothetical protein [Paracnuella aquatica]|uniref:hypothetical protein n=1 Tax=Paracnuella aquatica TaxID=2268757 RepID=UPI000DEFA946|nr:hypothetical protein [Paracnuella aquatica]RPD44008.1 hypothetical protein DRJ53_18120 [Paracnuella aquatica]